MAQIGSSKRLPYLCITNREHPVFPFVPSEAAKKRGHHGLHFFLFEGGNYKSAYSGTTGIHTILEFSLTKK